MFDIPANVNALRASGLDCVVIGVMHHYHFMEEPGTKVGWRHTGFDALLAWLTGKNDIQVMALARLASKFPPPK